MGQSWSGCVVDGVPTLSCIFPLFNNVLNIAFFLASIVALFFIIWAGLKLIRSNGDAKQVDSARKTLTYAIIGLILVFLSFLIVNFIATITGVDCIKQFSFTECN